MKKYLFIFVFLSLIGCQIKSPVTLSWELVANDVEPGVCEALFTITNVSRYPLDNDWVIYFNFMSLHPLYSEGDALKETEIQASWHSLEPTDLYEPILPGQSVTYTMRYRGNAIRETNVPEGSFMILGGKPVSVDCAYFPFSRKEQMMRGVETWEKTPYADGPYVYEYNQNILAHPMQMDSILLILPQPKKIEWLKGTTNLLSAPISINETANMVNEGYSIEILDGKVSIASGSESGTFYARQTLKQIMRNYTELQLSSFQNCRIIDFPDMKHRGIMLDISRNYYPVDSIYRVMDVMAEYKLNVLHLHLSDDEAWRLEIPGLPELTSVGGHRGFTMDETDCLLPMYCGGWNSDEESTANGYITRSEYIDLLKYAKTLQMCVIPEIDMPGHMRAAKKSMHGLLTDSVLEKRKYLSAQNYTDNVIAVSNPYAIEFVDKVVTEIVNMYKEADCELSIFNIGGDEVPNGALTKEEHQKFIDAVLEILDKNNLTPAGWEEIGHFCSPETNAICYSWHNGDHKPVEMADMGYQVVLAAANHLYFDFAYCNHHEEKGLNWGGYTDEYRSFDWKPVNHPNVIGMNAQLWSEVIRSFSQVEWQLFPKTYGLSERAWNNNSHLSLSEYNSLVYSYCLPNALANNHNFHLQQPGIKLEGGYVVMNKVMENGQILYTLDDKSWIVYSEPFAYDAYGVDIIKAKVRYLGHESNTTWFWPE